MHSYQIEATRTDHYEIEIDSIIWNEKGLKTWSNVFFHVDTLEELAEIIAKSLMKFELLSHHEGFGYIRTFRDGEEIIHTRFRDGDYGPIPDTEFAKGIKVHLISEEEYDCDTTEIIDTTE